MLNFCFKYFCVICIQQVVINEQNIKATPPLFLHKCAVNVKAYASEWAEIYLRMQ